MRLKMESGSLGGPRLGESGEERRQLAEDKRDPNNNDNTYRINIVMASM